MDNKIKPLFEPRECDCCGLDKDTCRRLYDSGRFIPVGNHKMYCVDCTEKLIVQLRNKIACLSTNPDEVLHRVLQNQTEEVCRSLKNQSI